jgi:hypothetical protein
VCLSIHELVVDFFFPTAEETILLVYGSSIFPTLFFFLFSPCVGGGGRVGIPVGISW